MKKQISFNKLHKRFDQFVSWKFFLSKKNAKVFDVIILDINFFLNQLQISFN